MGSLSGAAVGHHQSRLSLCYPPRDLACRFYCSGGWHRHTQKLGIALIALFSVVYGFFAGGYSSTWGGVVKELSTEAESHNEPVDTALIFGLLNGGRGIGWVAGGFIGVELLKDGALDNTRWAYGTKYGSLILATGIGAAFGGISIFLKASRLTCR